MDKQSKIMNQLEKSGVETKRLRIEEFNGTIILAIGSNNQEFNKGEIGEVSLRKFIKNGDVVVTEQLLPSVLDMLNDSECFELVDKILESNPNKTLIDIAKQLMEEFEEKEMASFSFGE
ncbi:MAG: hypothetical protein K0U78_15440 [Actinomycetia bacterium]|nr:hypothetical protein [Actinomycetes bacterium]